MVTNESTTTTDKKASIHDKHVGAILSNLREEIWTGVAIIEAAANALEHYWNEEGWPKDQPDYVAAVRRGASIINRTTRFLDSESLQHHALKAGANPAAEESNDE